MTLVLDFRSTSTPGAVVTNPRGLACDAAGNTRAIEIAAIGAMARGGRVLFAAHGFNVRRADALTLMTRLAQVADDCLFVGLSWPGDWWVKAVNYPGEAFDARDCGQKLARAIDTHFSGATSVSFLSHSLGARLVLEAARTRVAVEHIMLMAAAVDDDCLVRRDANAARKARVHVLSSKRDRVLRYAYPVGDFISDLLGDGDSPFAGALGYRGPRGAGANVRHTALPTKPSGGPASDFDHNDYLPGSPKSGVAMQWVRDALRS